MAHIHSNLTSGTTSTLVSGGCRIQAQGESGQKDAMHAPRGTPFCSAAFAQTCRKLRPQPRTSQRRRTRGSTARQGPTPRCTWHLVWHVLREGRTPFSKSGLMIYRELKRHARVGARVRATWAALYATAVRTARHHAILRQGRQPERP